MGIEGRGLPSTTLEGRSTSGAVGLAAAGGVGSLGGGVDSLTGLDVSKALERVLRRLISGSLSLVDALLFSAAIFDQLLCSIGLKIREVARCWRHCVESGISKAGWNGNTAGFVSTQVSETMHVGTGIMWLEG